MAILQLVVVSFVFYTEQAVTTSIFVLQQDSLFSQQNLYNYCQNK